MWTGHEDVLAGLRRARYSAARYGCGGQVPVNPHSRDTRIHDIFDVYFMAYMYAYATLVNIQDLCIGAGCRGQIQDWYHHCTPQHDTTLYYTTLHYPTALHYTTLHY